MTRLQMEHVIRAVAMIADDDELVTIGEGTPFDREFGYFAHGIGPETAVLPEGWDTLVVVVSNANTRGAKG